jgi:glycine/D-amino acid oxidase-like deaminating enzyme
MIPVEKVTADSVLPVQAGAVVIGGGVIGVMTALELAERGVDVVVVEKGEIAAEQSGRNWGWCRQMGRDSREIPLIKESLSLWRGMNARIGAETGFRECGILYLAATAQEIETRRHWVEKQARPNGIDSRIVTTTEVDHLIPSNRGAWAGGLYTPSDGRAEPWLAVPAMAQALQARGGKVFTQCAARGFERTAGRISAVVTERGTIKTDTAVVAGGYWSRRLLNSVGLKLPQLGTISNVARLSPVEGGPDTTFAGSSYAVRRRLDGGYTLANNLYSIADVTPASFRHFFDFLPALKMEWSNLKLRVGPHFITEAKLKSKWRLDERSPFEEIRVLDPAPMMHMLAPPLADLQKRYPVFSSAKFEEAWAGMIDVTPDAVPVIDRIESWPGLFLATGFSGHGFGIGPGAGKLMADLVTCKAPAVDPTPFRYRRFFDGSIIRPEAGL